jgi:hypothetical protein
MRLCIVLVGLRDASTDRAPERQQQAVQGFVLGFVLEGRIATAPDPR